ncbi:hypothetical protein A9168_12330 [Macellibacteroides sp. HH-ZS]|nr:hypothetical protein A9168_12330 [Macellibacteroides sp. HH-ZS]
MKRILLTGLVFISVLFGSGSAVKGDNLYSENYLNNRYPLLKKPYIKLPLGSIKPKGWMRQQLEIMRDGMTGNLDVVYEKVMGKRNGWLGGDGDVWERGPYWIDGLLPLAYILEDKRLIEKLKPWIEWTLASQKADGYFGQDTDRPNEPGLQRDNAMDWWPKMVMLKVMQQYYSATGDQRVIQFLDNYFRYQLKQLPANPLDKWTFWGSQRGGDNLMIVYWLYNITGEKYLLDLGELIHKQTFNWTDIFLNQNHLSRQHSLHCVNLAQGFKEPVVYYQQSKDYKHLEAVDKAVSVMRHTIGLPTGLWAGDELLRFGNPVYGSELCTAVEMMFSLEEILEVTGNTHWADYLERIAYNVLPTQVTDTYSARQYYQQVNQVSVTRNWRDFTTPHDDTDILFGELTGYPCCTSNLHQGWPKMVQNLIYATGDNGVAALVYAPCEAKVKVGDGKTLLLREETNYPFDEAIAFHFGFEDKKVKESFFPFRFRVPAWCTQPDFRLNGEKLSLDTQPGEIVSICRNWKTGDVLNVEFPAQVDISYWYDGGAVVERGPLLYALKMNEKWEKKNIEKEYVAKYGNWYFEVTSDSPWNYAFMKKNLQKESLPAGFIVEKKALKDGVYPWNVENAPLQIRTKANRIPSWTLYRGSAGPIPFNTQQGKDYTDTEETIELIPYGCTTLRIAQFPVR